MRCFYLWCLTVAVWLGGAPACGAALSGPAVLDAILRQLGPAQTLTVRQRVESVPSTSEPEARMEAFPSGVTGATETAFQATASAGLSEVGASAPPALPPVLVEDLTYQLPGGFRAEIQSEMIQRLYLQAGPASLLVIDGRLDREGGGWLDSYKDILLFTRRLELHRHLARKGVDPAVTSLGLWEERPVYVLGARFPDATPAQIWVDKASLLPLRWLWQVPVTPSSDQDAGLPADEVSTVRRYEIRYDRWQLFGKRRYPLRVQFFEDFRLVRTLTAEMVAVNTDLDPDLMDIEAVRRSALPAEADLPRQSDGDDPADVDEIQEAIDIFKQRYE